MKEGNEERNKEAQEEEEMVGQTEEVESRDKSKEEKIELYIYENRGRIFREFGVRGKRRRESEREIRGRRKSMRPAGGREKK